MKKGKLIVLFISVFLLGGCNYKKVTSTSSTTAESSTSSEKKVSTVDSTTTKQTSVSTSQTQDSSVVLEISQTSESLDTTFTEEQAIQKLKEYFNSEGFSNDDSGFVPMTKVGEDYIIKLVSLSMVKQGGSGSAGFYRVSPQGLVEATDFSGNPY